MAGNRLVQAATSSHLDYELEGEECDLYDAVTDFVSNEAAARSGERTPNQRPVLRSRPCSDDWPRRSGRSAEPLNDESLALRCATRRPRGVSTQAEAFQASLFDDDPEDTDDLATKNAGRWRNERWRSGYPTTVAELEAEREALGPLLTQAPGFEAKRTERKLNELLDVVNSQGLREDQSKKLLIFTEHKDTLDYLVENLPRRFEVAEIHGGLSLLSGSRPGAVFPGAGPDHGGHGGSWGGHQPSVLPPDGQLRHPVEPQPPRTAHGPHPPHWADQKTSISSTWSPRTPARGTFSTILHKMENMGDALGDPVSST